MKFENFESPDAILRGFTIKEGGNIRGSAINIGYSSAIIENCNTIKYSD